MVGAVVGGTVSGITYAFTADVNMTWGDFGGGLAAGWLGGATAGGLGGAYSGGFLGDFVANTI